MDEKSDRAFLFCVRAFKDIGYGRMMQIISHEWFRHDPIGAAVANTCYGLLNGDERHAYQSLAETDPIFEREKTT